MTEQVTKDTMSTLPSNYRVEPTRCGCHPETCGCPDYTVWQGESIVAKGMRKDQLESLVTAANSGAAHEPPAEQTCDDGLRATECPTCHGVGGGVTSDGIEVDCSTCDGEGSVVRPAQPPVPEWQPIETAPHEHDSTCIVAVPNYNNKTIKNPPMLVGEAHYIYDEDALRGQGWFWAGEDPTDAHGPGTIYPTHWMPLPAAPCSTSTKGEG